MSAAPDRPVHAAGKEAPRAAGAIASRRPRLPPALAGAGLGAGAIAVLLAAGLLIDRWPFALDRAIVVGLRRWGGPAWLGTAAVDVTALGSVTVLTLIVTATVVLLLAERRRTIAAVTALSCASVSPAIDAVKAVVARPRPTLVPHLVPVAHASFPSGHAAGSAAIYLTLAALASPAVRERAARRVLLVMAVLLTGMIGVSRVYLGVHWPSDVLAGWSFGTLWALAWWRGTAALRVVGPKG